MTRKLTGLLAALALGLSALPARAVFENVDVSPRARAMGDAAVAVADDAFAPYFNPAGLASLTQPALASSYVRPYALSFTDLIYVGGAFRVAGLPGSFGFGVRRFSVEWDDEDLVTGRTESVDLLSENTYTLSHGLTLYQDMHSTTQLGASLNLYNLDFGPALDEADGGQGIDPGSDTVAGLDVGLLVTLHERTRLGVLVKNLNNPQIGLEQEALQQRIHGGVAYEPYLGVITTFEFENVLGEAVQYHGGIEMAVSEGLFLRFGAMTQPSKLSAGFGYEVKGLGLHYGFSTGGGTLDSSHQFGLTLTWGGETP
jgi:hypothetical protein